MIKDLATTTVGAVVQPGTVLLTLVPEGEQLYADVRIKNQDAGFVAVGQRAQVKVATYPFQRHGMLDGTVVLVSADASESNGAGANRASTPEEAGAVAEGPSYKARVKLHRQELVDAHGNHLRIGAGMQVIAEIKQGKRTVLSYLLSPVQKAVAEAARER